jgi:hypothetical protein
MVDVIPTALASGLFAGLVAIGVTTGIERLGGTLGGVLATTPTTVIPSCVGLALRLAPESLPRALFAIPAGMLVNAVFLLQWRFWPSRLPSQWSVIQRTAAMVAISLSVWFVLASCYVSLNTVAFKQTTSVVVFGSISTALMFVIGLLSCLRLLEAPKGSKKTSLKTLGIRGCMASISVFTAIMLSQIDSVAAGFASTFPAIFLTAMASLWLSQGEGVPIGAVGPMVLGSIAVSAYALIFCGLFVGTGLHPVAVAVITYPITVLSTSVPVAFFLRRQRQRAAARAAALEHQPQEITDLRLEKQTAHDSDVRGLVQDATSNLRVDDSLMSDIAVVAAPTDADCMAPGSAHAFVATDDNTVLAFDRNNQTP